MILKPKDWEKFQHYKNRCPPWIKLHSSILVDVKFMYLPLASKALAPFFWLLASESKGSEGTFDASTENLVFRLHMSVKEIEHGRKHLIEKGFFIDASNMLAECKQHASKCLQHARPERETETEIETETELNSFIDGESLREEANQKNASKLLASKKRKIPQDWQPRTEEKTMAQNFGVDFEPLLLEFRDYHDAKGSVMANWDAALRTWIRNTKKWGMTKKMNGSYVNRQEALESSNSKIANRVIERMKAHE